jgi:DNA-binding PadR family transcriptional regulator
LTEVFFVESKAKFPNGCIRTLVLSLLHERPMYGYEVAVALKARSAGVFAVGLNIVYPLLYSLERKRLIRVSRKEYVPAPGRRRRYYSLTPAGRAELDVHLVTWRGIVRGMELVLGTARSK